MDPTIIKLSPELFATAESSHFEGDVSIERLNVGPDEYRFASPVSWAVDVTNTGSAFLVSGTASGVATCACSRCLDEVGYELEGDIEGYYLLSEEMRDEFTEDEDAPGEDEFEVLPDDHRIDLLPLIKAALIVEAPNLPLCQDDCKGLCPQCGTNLNEGTCHCQGKGDDGTAVSSSNPFAALADIDFGEN